MIESNVQRLWSLEGLGIIGEDIFRCNLHR